MSIVDPMVAQAKGGPRLIKRYANRKLYDTCDSRYVTLQQIAEFVRGGEDVRIIDNKSKEDLTNVTLAQIIYEEQKNADDDGEGSSVRSLRSFIQEGRERLMTSLRDGPMGKLVARRESDPEGDPSDVGAVVEGLEEESSAERRERKSDRPPEMPKSPKEAFEELQRLADDRVRSVVGSAMSHVQQLQGEVRRLQARIEELEERLKNTSRRSSRRDGES